MKARRLIVPFFALAGLVLIPWSIWLTLSLPAHHETSNWRTVWGGFDLAEAAALVAVALTALRGSLWLAPAAAIAGTLLCVDAWFDVTLEAGDKHLLAAVLAAVFVELPLAGICFWVARDAERALDWAMPSWRRAAVRAFSEPIESTPEPD